MSYYFNTKSKGQYSKIAGFLITELSLEICRLGLPYFTPKEFIIKGDNLSGYEPDVIILDQNLLENKSSWEGRSTIISGKTIQLVN